MTVELGDHNRIIGLLTAAFKSIQSGKTSEMNSTGSEEPAGGTGDITPTATEKPQKIVGK